MTRGLLVCAAALAAVAASCTLTHSLDGYSAEYGVVDASPVALDDADALDDAGSLDAADTLDASDPILPPPKGDAGDGCIGVPQILSPTANEVVGQYLRVTVSAPVCITTMIVYIDSVGTIKVSGSAIDQSIPLETVGTHQVNVNGWAGTNQAHTSPIIKVVRSK